MPRVEEGIFLGYTDTSCNYKVHILACNHTFIVFALNVKFADASVTADSCLKVEVTMVEVTTVDVTMLDINLDNSLITMTLVSCPTITSSISFVRPIICSMTDS